MSENNESELEESQDESQEESSETTEEQESSPPTPDPYKKLSVALQNEQYKRSHLEKELGSIKESLNSLTESIQSNQQANKSKEEIDPNEYATVGVLKKMVDEITGKIDKTIEPIKSRQMESDANAKEQQWLSEFDQNFPDNKGNGPEVLKEFHRQVRHISGPVSDEAQQEALEMALELVSLRRSLSSKKTNKTLKSPSGTTRIVQDGASATQSTGSSSGKSHVDARGNPDWSGVLIDD